MQRSSLLLFNAYLNTLPAEKKRKYLSYFSPKIQEEIESLPLVPKPNPSDFSLSRLFKKVHYSWFLPTLKAYPKKDAALFLGAFPEEMQQALKGPLEISKKREVAKAGISFLQKHMLSSLREEKDALLPPEYLPPSPVSKMALFSKNKLIEILHFLSFYDLAYELKFIVETKLLKKIYAFLSEREKNYLGKISRPQEGDRLHLDHWDQTKENLYLLLHRKGLKRLGSALQNEPESLKWHIAHTLDIGRGSALLKICEKKVTANLTQAIMRNLMDVLAFLEA